MNDKREEKEDKQAAASKVQASKHFRVRDARIGGKVRELPAQAKEKQHHREDGHVVFKGPWLSLFPKHDGQETFGRCMMVSPRC